MILSSKVMAEVITESRTFPAFSIADLQGGVDRLRESVTHSLGLVSNLAVKARIVQEQILDLKDRSKKLAEKLASPIPVDDRQLKVDDESIPLTLHSLCFQLDNKADSIGDFKPEVIMTNGNEILRILSECFEPALALINQINGIFIGAPVLRTFFGHLNLSPTKIDDLQQGIRGLKDFSSRFLLDIKNLGTKMQALTKSVATLQERCHRAAERLTESVGDIKLDVAGSVIALRTKLCILANDSQLLSDLQSSVSDLDACPTILEQTANEVDQARLEFIDPALDAAKRLTELFTGEVFVTKVLSSPPSETASELSFGQRAVAANGDEFKGGESSPLVEPLKAELALGKYSESAVVYDILNNIKIQPGENESRQRKSVTIVKKWFDKGAHAQEAQRLTIKDFYDNEAEVRRILGIQQVSRSVYSTYPALRRILNQYYEQFCLVAVNAKS